MFPTFETERLLLREIKKVDALAIYNWFSNNEVTRYYGQETLTSVEQASQFVEFFARSYLEKRGIRWGIEIKGKEEGLIGSIGFNAWSPKQKRAEIGYELHPDHWQKGYASEAASAVIAYGFQELDLARIGAVVFMENEASHALLIKLGFEVEGILRNYMYQNGTSYDTRVYSLLNT